MEVLGKIKVINPLKQLSASFQKQELVVATDEQYPQFISINFVQNKCGLLKNYKVGDNVKVSINLRGREWINPQGEAKYFNDIQGWRIEKTEDNPQSNQEQFAPATNFNDQEPNEMPF
jgi:translation initiation factor IF-3